MFARTSLERLHKKGVQRFSLKMLIATMAVIATSSIAFSNQIYGASVNQGTVKAKSGNVRQSASTTASVAFCVKADDTVAILGEEKDSSGNTWYKILVCESVGYIRSDLVTKTNNKVTVKDSLVAVSKQDSSSTSKEEAKEENQLNAQKENITANSVDTSKLNVGVVNASYVRMRNGASVTAQMITYLDKGAVVIITGEGKSANGEVWYQVKSGNNQGFIRSDLINKVTRNTQDDNTDVANSNNTTDATVNEENDNNEADNQNQNVVSDDSNIIAGSGTVNATVVRVRDAATVMGNILAVVNTGDNLPILGRAKSDGRQWLKVKVTSNGVITDGYIAADYVTVNKEPEIKQESSEEEVKENTETPVIEAAEEHTASIKGVGVRVRQTPVTGNVICQLSSGHPLTLGDVVDADDGHRWYQVSFSYQGNAKVGYVREDFVAMSMEFTGKAPIGDEAFEATIAPLPDSYKNSLRALHVMHPTWNFQAIDTGLEWSDALRAESAVGKNLVSKNSIASWKSTAAQAYNWSNNTWYTFDGGSWASASPELIAYYMDPRNFLNESGIYQFETFEYKDTQKQDSVAKMLTGTFMSDSFTDTDGSTGNYADVFVRIGQLTGVSPYLLAGRCIQEQGIFGKSQSIAGNVPGYEGYFNYFNVGAYAYSGRSATINGLIYAKGNDSDNLRPWNSRVKSIYGGAKYISDKFISKGQDTLYFQKFNVVNAENTLYSHQYMSNIQAASSESARIQLAYLGDDEALTFKIPFYRNMPSVNCVKPTSDSSPNTYLASLSVDGYELIPAFSGATENYVVNVDSSTEYITINAVPVSKTSSVGGAGTYQVAPGSSKYTIGCKSQNGSVKLYTITVQK